MPKKGNKEVKIKSYQVKQKLLKKIDDLIKEFDEDISFEEMHTISQAIDRLSSACMMLHED